MGEISKNLGIRVTRDRKNRTMDLDQELSMEHICARFGIPEATHRKKMIPLDGYEALQPATEDDERVDRTDYQQAVGSIMRGMLMTRPDISFAVGRLSQYLQDPAVHHALAVKKLLRYLKSTSTVRIRYQRGTSKTFRYLGIYSDADYVSDEIDRVSLSGQVAMLCGGPVCYAIRKHKSVATATTESEYIAMASRSKIGQ